MGIWQFFAGKKKPSNEELEKFINQNYTKQDVYEYYGLFAKDKFTIVDTITTAPKEYRTTIDGKTYSQSQIASMTREYAKVDGKWIPNPSEIDIRNMKPTTMYVRNRDQSGPYYLKQVENEFVSGSGENDMMYFFMIVGVIILLIAFYYIFFYKPASNMDSLGPNTSAVNQFQSTVLNPPTTYQSPIYPEKIVLM